MENTNHKLLSLCIPTNGSLSTIKELLYSIYNQGCDESLFEVLISDNAKNEELRIYIEQFDKKNLRYHESNAQGFMNIIDSLQHTSGEFCKLINHRAILLPGSLGALLKMVENNMETQPVIYCTNGVVGGTSRLCKDLDELVYNLHYYCTWMAGIGVWKKDIFNLKNIDFNKMFPNTSILFEQRLNASEYLLFNDRYFKEQDGRGKGCYNLFHTFAVVFPDMLFDLRDRGRIKDSTLQKVLKDLLYCLRTFYRDIVILSNDTSFDLSGIRKNMSVYYPWYSYYRMTFSVLKEIPWNKKMIVIKQILNVM